MIFKVQRLSLISVLLVALLGLTGCETIQDFLDGVEGSGQEPVDVPTYFDGPKVRPGIALSISVTAVGAANRDMKSYFVDAEGYITMELVGKLKVEGLSLVDLQKTVETAYKKYYLEPSVTATFLYQPNQNMVSPWGTVKVLGEVHRPGPVDVPPTCDLTVTRALVAAGGCTSLGDKSRVRVTRCDKDGKQTRMIVDIPKMGSDGRPEMDIQLKAGDVVWVPMSWY